MLTRFHRMILRMLPGPLVGWLTALMFLLLMQFLIRYMKELVGKGLPATVIFELVTYSLAYMLVLAVPMSVLIATLMTFGRLAETRSYAVIKSAGVSLPQLVWPALCVGMLMTGFMWYFNSKVLPEANFRAATLWKDIRQKKPGFAIQPGVFYEGVDKYSILVGGVDGDANELEDITIYDYSAGTRHRAEIKAERGSIVPLADGSSIDLVLENGELHRFVRDSREPGAERYERLRFERHKLRLSIEDFTFERTDPSEGRRSDRTMRTEDMAALVDSLRASVAETKEGLRNSAMLLAKLDLPAEDLAGGRPVDTADATPAPDFDQFALAGLGWTASRDILDGAAQKARLTRTEIDNAGRAIRWKSQRADRFAVEIHKKHSIALACVVFMLIGAPLGLSIRRGSLGVSGALAIGIFLFYWVTLVYGEKLADRDLLAPWVGMWIANIVTGLVGLYVVLYVSLDIRATPTLRRRLKERMFARDG